jgi:hypothetical protein
MHDVLQFPSIQYFHYTALHYTTVQHTNPTLQYSSVLGAGSFTNPTVQSVVRSVVIYMVLEASKKQW